MKYTNTCEHLVSRHALHACFIMLYYLIHIFPIRGILYYSRTSDHLRKRHPHCKGCHHFSLVHRPSGLVCENTGYHYWQNSMETPFRGPKVESTGRRFHCNQIQSQLLGAWGECEQIEETIVALLLHYGLPVAGDIVPVCTFVSAPFLTIK